jgi:hypothetical protein
MGSLRAFAVVSCATLVFAACGHNPGPSSGSSAGGRGGSSSADAGGSGGTTPGVGTVECLNASGPGRACAAGEYCCDERCASGDLPCSRADIRCDEAADCPNAFCCMTKISKRDGGAQNARCQASCDTENQLILCKYSGKDAACPAGMRCEITATLPPLYGYCCAPGTLCQTT